MTSVTGTANRIAKEIARHSPQRLALLGHSFGALVMYETAHALERLGYGGLTTLIVSGHAAPDAAPINDDRHTQTDEDLLAFCRRLGADEIDQLCKDPQMRPLILGPLCDDLRMIDTYRWQARKQLDVPVLVLRGADDPATVPERVAGWARLTTDAVKVTSYSGGHFFTRTSHHRVVADVEQHLSTITQPHRQSGTTMEDSTLNRLPASNGGNLDPASIAKVFAEVLKRQSHPESLSLMAAGGDSLDAIHIAQRLSAMTTRPVPVAEVLSNPAPNLLAAALKDTPISTSPPPRPEPIARAAYAGGDTWRLPSPQKRIWLLHERDPSRLDHLVTVSLEITGTEITAEAMTQAWLTVFRRHPVLRMRITDADEPHAIADGPEPALRYLDTNALPEVLADDLVAEELNRLRNQPFNLYTGVVARGLLVRRPDSTLTLDIVLHHIACDGWSLRILIDELFEIAVAINHGRKLKLPRQLNDYAAFVDWEESRRQHWAQQVRSAVADMLPVPSPLELPCVSDSDTHASEVTLSASARWRKRLQEAFDRHGYSTLVIGLVAAAITLQRLSGQDAMYMAVPLANRPMGFDDVIGDFVNTSIVRVDLSDTSDVHEVLRRTAQQVSRVYEAQDLPFEELAAGVRDAASSPEAARPRVAVTVQNIPRYAGSYDDGRLHVARKDVAERQSKYDIVITLGTAPASEGISVTAAAHVFGGSAAEAFIHRVDKAIDLVLTQLGV